MGSCASPMCGMSCLFKRCLCYWSCMGLGLHPCCYCRLANCPIGSCASLMYGTSCLFKRCLYGIGYGYCRLAKCPIGSCAYPMYGMSCLFKRCLCGVGYVWGLVYTPQKLGRSYFGLGLRPHDLRDRLHWPALRSIELTCWVSATMPSPQTKTTGTRPPLGRPVAAAW